MLRRSSCHHEAVWKRERQLERKSKVKIRHLIKKINRLKAECKADFKKKNKRDAIPVWLYGDCMLAISNIRGFKSRQKARRQKPRYVKSLYQIFFGWKKGQIRWQQNH